MASDADDDIRLALAVRDLVLAAERYRIDSARHRIRMGATETVALGHLYVTGPMTASELAAELAITSASATELVDRLEDAGFARRGPHPTDRRKRLVTLTSHGKQTVSQIYRGLGRQIGTAYRTLPPERRNHIDEFLAAASAALTEHHADHAATRISASQKRRHAS